MTSQVKCPVKKHKITPGSSSDRNTRKQKNISQSVRKTWKKTVRFDKEFISSSVRPLGETYPVLLHLPPMAYFDFLFDEAVFKLCDDQSLLYAGDDKNDPTFTVTVGDVHQFCGILLLHCHIFGNKTLSHLEFRRQVALTLITSSNSLAVVHKDLCQLQCSTTEMGTSVHRVIKAAVVFVRKRLV